MIEIERNERIEIVQHMQRPAFSFASAAAALSANP